VQVLHSLSRGLFSLEFLFLGRLGVVPSVLEFLIEALLDDYVLELGHGALHTVIGFHFNRYHSAPVCSCSLMYVLIYESFNPYTSIIPCVKSFVNRFWVLLYVALSTVNIGWGSCCNVQLSVVVIDVCGGGLKWPNEDD